MTAPPRHRRHAPAPSPAWGMCPPSLGSPPACHLPGRWRLGGQGRDREGVPRQLAAAPSWPQVLTLPPSAPSPRGQAPSPAQPHPSTCPGVSLARSCLGAAGAWVHAGPGALCSLGREEEEKRRRGIRGAGLPRTSGLRAGGLAAVQTPGTGPSRGHVPRQHSPLFPPGSTAQSTARELVGNGGSRK